MNSELKICVFSFSQRNYFELSNIGRLTSVSSGKDFVSIKKKLIYNATLITNTRVRNQALYVSTQSVASTIQLTFTKFRIKPLLS